MSQGLHYHDDLARWELRLAPETAWGEAESPAPGVTVRRTAGGAVAVVAVDADPDGSLPPASRAAVLEATGIDLDVATDGSPPILPGRLGSAGDGTAFSMPSSAPVGVDPGRTGRWAFDDDRLTATITVPVEPGTAPDDLWVSVVEIGTGHVLAAGALSMMDEAEAGTTLTMAVPFVSDDVRIDIGRLAPAPSIPAPSRWVFTALVGVVALVVAAIVGGISVWTESGVESVGDLVFVAQIVFMAAEMGLSVLLVDRLWRFPLLRPLVGFVVVVAVWAYSNVLYSMLNLGMGWGTWYADLAENLQWSTIILLPVAAAWAFVGLLRRGARR
ncbi:MAG: hypothetical protein AB1Z57_05025 [Acidimicrobiia bacterium]